VWCQGFSEPGAGSDLASLSTRGVVDGDDLVVNGQKIWTSYAHLADWQELLVRTEPGSERHRGLTWVICDMHAPGVDVRPIATIDGGHEFCEVFYDDVRIPLTNVVGGLGNGWSVAMATLGFERGTAFAAQQVDLDRQIDRLEAAAASLPGPLGQPRALDDDAVAAELASIRAACDAVRSMTYLTVARNARTAAPGPEGSLVRLYFSELLQRFSRLAMEILGPDALRLTGFEDGFTRRYFYSYAETIGGGTAEIQREIIGERVLGLPRGR
jgi:alkylation response protein AidB-like acyl-CoA dehydrogenase